jgi:hypothetical protein
MKRNLIYTLITGFLVLGMLSFTLIKEKPVTKRTVTKTTKVLCNATINPLTAANVSWSSSSITISWTPSNSNYDHFNYGGYGVVSTGSTTGFSKSYSFPPGVTSRFGVVCACADGSTSGVAHGVLFSSTGYSIF